MKSFDKEHVTLYIRMSGLFRTNNFMFYQDNSHLRWTLDETADYTIIKNFLNILSLISILIGKIF